MTSSQPIRTLARLVMALCLPVVAMSAGLGTSAASAQTATTPVAIAPDSYESRVQHWVNRVRRDHGLPTLRMASCTDHVAERWSAHLARTGEFHHQSMFDVLDHCDALYAGETLGRGGMTPRQLVQLWMESAPHRAVLLSEKSKRIGVGAEQDAFGRWVVAANFMRF